MAPIHLPTQTATQCDERPSSSVLRPSHFICLSGLLSFIFLPIPSSAPSLFFLLPFVCAAVADVPLAKEGMVAVTFDDGLSNLSPSHDHHTCGQTVRMMKREPLWNLTRLGSKHWDGLRVRCEVVNSSHWVSAFWILVHLACTGSILDASMFDTFMQNWLQPIINVASVAFIWSPISQPVWTLTPDINESFSSTQLTLTGYFFPVFVAYQPMFHQKHTTSNHLITLDCLPFIICTFSKSLTPRLHVVCLLVLHLIPAYSRHQHNTPPKI